MKYNVLSLFGGMECGRVILDQLNVEIESYLSSEINPHPIKVVKRNYPDVVHVGDVRNLKVLELLDVNLILMGSPCQGFSMAGKRKGMTTVEDLNVTSLNQYLDLKEDGVEFHSQSVLFWEAMRLVQGITDMRSVLGLEAPLWLMENVNMDQKNLNLISNALGVDPYHINASLLTCQNRDRFYWTNIPGVTIPEDKGELVWDVIPEGVTGVGVRGKKLKGDDFYTGVMSKRKDWKVNCFTLTSSGTSNKTGKPYGCSLIECFDDSIRALTIEEKELIQGVPVGYTNVPGVPKTAREKMIGNGWSIKTVKHILQNLIPQEDYELDPAGGYGLESHI